MAELATLERLMKERAHLKLIVGFLEEGQVDKAVSILKDDIAVIDAAIEAK